MIKKRKKVCWGGWFLPVALFIALFFILPLFDFLEDKEFDQEKDVCLDEWWNDCDKIELFENGIDKGNYWVCSHKEEFNESQKESLGADGVWFSKECLEWRPKTECEKGNSEYVLENSTKIDAELLKKCSIEIGKTGMYMVISTIENMRELYEDTGKIGFYYTFYPSNNLNENDSAFVNIYPARFEGCENSYEKIFQTESICRTKTPCELNPENAECGVK